jgi:hypothetical protein
MSKKKDSAPVATAPVLTSATSDSVWVVRSDGSKQCEGGAITGLDADAALLKKNQISVLEAGKKDDGKMHVAMCGASTGVLNGFKILKKDLVKAQGFGFREKQIEGK